MIPLVTLFFLDDLHGRVVFVTLRTLVALAPQPGSPP